MTDRDLKLVLVEGEKALEGRCAYVGPGVRVTARRDADAGGGQLMGAPSKTPVSVLCPDCQGIGSYIGTVSGNANDPRDGSREECETCDGAGRICECGEPIPWAAAAEQVLCRECVNEEEALDEGAGELLPYVVEGV